jgi:phenylacetate-CoA ligase
MRFTYPFGQTGPASNPYQMNELVKYYSKNNLLTLRKYREIARYYEMDPGQLLSKYNDAFIEIFKTAYKNSAFYKKFYQEHGIAITDIRDLTDIKKLPIIDRQIIKHQVNDIYNGFDFLKIKGLTSGTSGSPLTVYRTPVNIATEQAYLRHYRDMHGYTAGQPLLSIRGVLGKDTAHEYYKKANILYISSPNINENTIELYYKMIKDFNPVAIEAFPSYIYKFCNELEKKGLELEIPVAFTSSETLYDFQREKVEAYLKTIIFDWYGNVERSIGIAQDSNLKYYPLPLYSINEFETDRVITTALINKNFPLIRYSVDDRLTLGSYDFLKNLVTPDIIRIEGRAGDNLELSDGSVVGCIDHAFKGISNLDIAQVHSFGRNKPIEIKLVVTPSFGKQDETDLRRNISRLIGNGEQLMFTYCSREDLTYSANQKYKLIIKHK